MTDQPIKKRGQGRSQLEAAKLSARRAEVFRRFIAGEPQIEIGRALGISPPLVCLDIQAAVAEFRERNRGSIAEAAEHELRRLNYIELNAALDYERSRLKDNGEKQPGDPRYLKIMLECSQERRKLMGVDAPARSEIKTTSEIRTFKTRDEMQADVLKLVRQFRARAQSSAPSKE